MLANGATLGYKKKAEGEGSYTILDGLKEIPDIGTEARESGKHLSERTHKKYEMGIGDLPDMVYKFKFENSSAQSSYRVLRTAQEKKEVLSFQEKDADGTTIEFDAQVSVKRTGGGVNGVIDTEVTMLVQSDIKFTDPA